MTLLASLLPSRAALPASEASSAGGFAGVLGERAAELVPLALAAVVAGLFAFVLVRLAGRWSLVDAAGGPESHRKRQRHPVPVVGGPALVAGVLAGMLWMYAGSALPAAGGPGTLALSLALCVALAVGLADDLRPSGLDWRVKLGGQCAVAAAWVLPGLFTGGLAPSAALGFALVCVVAQNAFNTFDNADGAASGIGLFGLAGVAPAAAGAVLGFLPFNVLRRRAGPPAVAGPGPQADGERGRDPRADPPHAYLGDSGSHVLGVLVAAHPAAWPALLLPCLDLARLCVVRWRAGQAPWVGDRRHLAHRLEGAGLGPGAVLGVLVAIAAPASLGARLGAPYAGGAATAVLFALALGIRRRAARTEDARQGIR